MNVFPIRMLNNRGIDHFRSYLHHLAADQKASPPREILYSPSHSTDWPHGGVIEPRKFASRLEAVRYLSRVLGEINYASVDNDEGLWSWLSLFCFDEVCPPYPGGGRRPGRDYRHIPDRSYRYQHRHLLAGPHQVYRAFGDGARLLLASPVYIENSFHHELAGRQNFISNPAIIEAATILYFDEKKGKPKFGSNATGKPGTLRRFVDVIQQIDVTYDLHSMSSESLLSLLPAEFDAWKGSPLLSLHR